MWRPKIIKIPLKANLGITTFRPINAETDIANIGPNIQASGTLKNSAIIALGVEIKITNKNWEDTKDLISFLLNGIAFDMYSINGCWH